MATYLGSDRRRHELFVTKNTEYHLRDRTCVAVRDVRSGRWTFDHPVIGRRLFGGLRNYIDALQPLAEPEVNAMLWFENGINDIITSRLTVVGRPSKSAVDAYPPC